MDSVDEAVAACARIPELDRATIRRVFEQKWTARRMAEDYVEIYERLIFASGRPHLRAVGD